MSRQKISLVVFDWDGTVMDSTANIVACMRQSLQDVAAPVPPDVTLQGTIGLALAEGFRRVLAATAPELAAAAVERYRHHWIRDYRHRSIPFEGVETMLGELAEKGHYLAVATGKGRVGLDRDLERMGFEKRFLTTRTVDEAPSKPHPGMLLSIMDELGVSASETLMVGDTSFDLEMAKNARVASLAVLCGSHTEEELRRHSPLACLENTAEVSAWLTAYAASP